MAPPVITIHDALGTEITTPLTLPTASPGTPTAATQISVRNNDAAGPAVDTAFNVVFSYTIRILGASSEPSSDGLVYAVQRALEARVAAVSGGATAVIASWRPLGAGATLPLGSIPDGGIVTIEIRTNAPLAAATQNVELFLAAESTESTALEGAAYELHGNFVYDGRTRGVADPLFSQLRSETGDWTVSGPPNADVNTPTEVQYTLQGVAETYTPIPASITFNTTDGDSATLAVGEAYYAALTLAAGGTVTVTKGSKNTAPLTESDKPTPPADELLRLWVVVPQDLAIDTIEFVGQLGFFGLDVVSGLNVTIGEGKGQVGGRWVDTQTSTSLALADSSTLTIYRQPESGLEVIASTSSPTDPRSMPLWDVTTSGGAVTGQTDRRVIGATDSLVVPADVFGELKQINPTGAGGPHVTVVTAGTFVGWTTAVAGVAKGGVTLDTADATADEITVPEAGDYEVSLCCSFAGSNNATITCRVHVNNTPNDTLFVRKLSTGGDVGSAAAKSTITLSASDEIDARFDSDGNGDTVTIYFMTLSVKKLRG